jgi:two-component system NtrC family sensor kinase
MSLPKILVVSSSRDTAAWLGRVLAEDGEVETMTDGAAAFQRVWETNYDVIVTELGVPGIDGRDLYMALRNTWPELAERMIFVSATTNPKADEFAERTGVPFVRDPVAAPQLRDAVRLVRTRRSNDTVSP